jgi:hypothetical protein
MTSNSKKTVLIGAAAEADRGPNSLNSETTMQNLNKAQPVEAEQKP